MHDAHLPAIAAVGTLVLAGVTLLWNVLRALRTDVATRLDALASTMSSHIATDAAAFAAHETQLVSHEKRLDKFDAA